MRLGPLGKWLIATASVAVVTVTVSLSGKRPVSVAHFVPTTPPPSKTEPVRFNTPPPSINDESERTTVKPAVETAVASAAAKLPIAAVVSASPAPAEFQVGRQVPVGWTMRRTEAAQRGETVICFAVPGHPKLEPMVAYHAFSEPTILWSTDLRAWLNEAAEAKAVQRVREGISDYQNRPKMLPRVIGSRPALSWSAEFTRDGEPWVENLTRLFSPSGTALFFLKAPAAEIEEVQCLFDIVIESTVMPSLASAEGRMLSP